jgi:hypothetical protein
MKPKDVKYSQKEIAALLNNCVIAQKSAIEKISIPRLSRLQEYTKALTEPCFKHEREGLLTKNEVTFILSSAALYSYMKLHGIKNLPGAEFSNKVVDE